MMRLDDGDIAHFGVVCAAKATARDAAEIKRVAVAADKRRADAASAVKVARFMAAEGAFRRTYGMCHSDAGHYIDEDGVARPCLGSVAAGRLESFRQRFREAEFGA
tara:strand:- start:1413 stop:1730 length:318 start_codon:yes stop_codon:yes gene_type:complete